jgi:precorrin-8X/cobalt-precorrin-8 methylmutase
MSKLPAVVRETVMKSRYLLEMCAPAQAGAQGERPDPLGSCLRGNGERGRPNLSDDDAVLPRLTRSRRGQIDPGFPDGLRARAEGRPDDAPLGAGISSPSQRPWEADEGRTGLYTYLRDPAAISRRSAALIRAEVDLARFPRSLRRLALGLAQAAGDTAILDRLDWSRGAFGAGRRAVMTGAPILVDATMVAAGISRERLSAANDVICTLRDPIVAKLAASRATTRSAAGVELWRPHLSGAVVAIGNAPTALFHLLEIIAAEGAKPALILGFPVGFAGAAEAKRALASFGHGLAYVTLHGRRGGSALAATAVNALAGPG